MCSLKSELNKIVFPLGDALLSDYVRKHANDMPEKTVINYYGREITFKELDQTSDYLAVAISDLGYKKEDRLGIFLQPCPQCFLLYLSCMKLGMIVVPIDPMSRELELKYFLDDSGAQLIATMDDLYPIVKSVKEKCGVKDVIVTSFSDYLLENPTFPIHPMMKARKQSFHGTHGMLELIDKGKYRERPNVDVKLSDYGYILYTGGTTGWPKGCVHTHRDLIYCGFGQSEFNFNKPSKEDNILSSWPLTHISGITLSLAPTLLTGMTVTQLARWEPIAAMEAIEKNRITITAMAVPSYYDILNHPDVKKYDLTSLRMSFIIPFARAISDDVVNGWEELTGCPVYDWGYGSSEHMNYCGYGYGLRFPRPLCSTFSRPLPEVEIKIIDFETGKELPEGKEGEIVTKEPAQLKKYWNKPKETEEDIVDGWVHMHDRGYIKDGILYFLGKVSDIVKVSGYTVALKEVEMFCLENPDVERIAVIGIPHPKKGNELKAFVVLKAGSQATALDIEEWCKEKLAVFKRPIVEIRSELPLSGKGDTLKRELIKEEEARRKVLA